MLEMSSESVPKDACDKTSKIRIHSTLEEPQDEIPLRSTDPVIDPVLTRITKFGY
jgi:hypothetical protein